MVLTLQPMGYVGEICVSGDCLSKGYLYNKEKTNNNSFVYCKDIDKRFTELVIMAFIFQMAIYHMLEELICKLN